MDKCLVLMLAYSKFLEYSDVLNFMTRVECDERIKSKLCT